MKHHLIYIGAYDESLTGQDVVIILEEAMSWASEDYRKCIADNGGESSPNTAEYVIKRDRLDGIFVMEDEPEPPFDPWGSEEDFPKRDWVYEVMNEDTTLGYVDWVLAKREEKELDDEQH